MCLGSYCFLWGQKQESTATWHGLFLSDGKATDGVDAMHKAWLGEWPDFRSPSIQHIGMNDSGWESEHVFPTEAEVVVDVTLEEWFDDVSWRCALFPESTSQKTGGDRQESLEEIPLSYTISDQGTFEFTTPRQPGAYRVFVTACREDAKCSSANIAFLVTE